MVSIDKFIQARLAEDEAEAEAKARQVGDGSWNEEYTQRVMECAENRATMELYGTEPGGMSVLKGLASRYADHPDYRKEWV